MGQLIYDENTLVENQMYKYDKFLHSRINKYTGSGRTLVKYWNINDANTSTSLGMGTHYQILGIDSPLRYDEIDNMILLGFSPLAPEDSQASSTTVRNYNLSGEAFIIPGTVMPKENDFFVVKHLKMEHLFRVTQVAQDGLNTDGSYKISYSLFSTNPKEINSLEKQTVNHMIMDLQTVGGSDLTPVIGKEDYEKRSRLIKMVNDMIENYRARFYDKKHNCFICHLNGRAIFDLCACRFMARTGIMIDDNATQNIVVSENKVRANDIDFMYEKSPYKWIERDAPLRYLETFKYHTTKVINYPQSSFAKYGDDIDVMIPHDPWCNMQYEAMYFPMPVYEILAAEVDPRCCCECDCKSCNEYLHGCPRDQKLNRRDYVALIHDYIHGKITSIDDLSLYIGDQLFDYAMSLQIYLWTPLIIYIIKQTLKIK